jgi:putative sigma-54 modulation protein
MEVHIISRNYSMDDSIKQYIRKKLNKFSRFYSQIYSCEVILEEEKQNKKCEIVLALNKKHKVVATETSPDMHASFDNAVDNATKQLTRLHDKIFSSRRKLTLKNIIMGPVMKIKGGDRPDSEIVNVDTYADKPMSPEDAKLELKMTGAEFIMFKNADTGDTNVLYRKSDGNYGLVEPKF